MGKTPLIPNPITRDTTASPYSFSLKVAGGLKRLRLALRSVGVDSGDNEMAAEPLVKSSLRATGGERELLVTRKRGRGEG